MATFTLAKSSCHNWLLTNDDEVTVSTVKLYTYLDVLLDDELEFDDQDECAINLEDYDGGDDGVFYIQIAYVSYHRTDNNDSGLTRYAYACIYDLCDAESCYKSLFKFVLCKCNDPCDQDCQDLYDMEQKRMDLELIYALYTTIERLVYYDKYRYYGSDVLSASRKANMAQIGRAIEKLAVVVNRCGMCTDEIVEDITC